MIKAIGVAAALTSLVLAGPALAAGTPAAGAQKIKTFGCINCHGRDGVSKLPEAPNLSGQVEVYLASSLQAYRSGARKNEIMNTVAATLPDDAINDLASYYASIAVAVTPPPRP